MAKPKGEEYKQWCQQWARATHEEKLKLAEEAGISYETARHWYSDAPAEFKDEGSSKMSMLLTPEEVVNILPRVALDFVMFDIETSGFDADWDILLTAAIKPYGQETIVFRADNYPTWETNRADDRLITIDVANELRKHAIVVGHYSRNFDIRFLRAKMLRHGLEPLPPMFGLDTWQVARSNFKVSNRRLKSLGVFAKIELPKDEPEGDRWMRAAFNGDKDAMDKIVKHNIEDVILLERIASISFPYIKTIPRL